ncbi:PAS domain-containing sensor histidine kinase [Cellulophaga tyrosinoxydans]|uniref:PAS domain-containing sensor histidine kinase n=1 Tax=Cellulophaga tyrosinoxydans TaxID=504486 RepID=UPI0013564BFC|nr:PAS domain-containing sensor histidine kinase [Cellulophaga tyrosinoxydans]
MKLISPLHSLSAFPFAIAIIDLNFHIKDYSEIWIEEFPFPKNGTEISLKNLNILSEKLIKCINDVASNHVISYKKIEIKSKNNNWYSWNIAKAIDEEGNISGIILSAENITYQKREIQLLNNAVQVAQIGSWELDLLSNKLYWSSITKYIHDLTDDFIPSLEQGINFYKPGKHREKIAKLVNNAITSGKPWDTELIIITAKNVEKWVRAKGEVEFVNGKCIRVFGTFQDINKQKLKDLKYNEVTNRLKIATKTARIGIWEYNYENKHLFWSNEMFSLYNIDKQKFNGHSSFWNQSLHPDDKEFCSKKIEECLAKKEDFEIEFRIIVPNGKIRHIKSVACVELDSSENNIVKLVGANWDISELIHSKLQLSKTEESLQQAFENSSVGMALISLEGNWINVNSSLCNSVGYSKEEMIQTKITNITHPDDLSKDTEFLKQMHLGEISNYTVNKRFYHKNGSIITANLTVTTVKKVSGHLSHFIAQLIDISPMIAAENKTKSLLEITKNQNNSLLNFAHIVSHNLRSHATNLLMLTNFIKDETDPNEKAHLEVMLQNASESLNETVHHLNDVVHISTNAEENLRSVNLFNSVKRVKKNISAILEENNAKCVINIPKNLKIKAVPAYLDSILLNLFTNSVKYKSEKRDLVIELNFKIKNDDVILYFLDNGQGIDLERHQNKIFGMYKTFHQHKDAKGIGLFITKNQIEAMNGSITVESIVDKETLFILTFKKAEQIKN